MFKGRLSFRFGIRCASPMGHEHARFMVGGRYAYSVVHRHVLRSQVMFLLILGSGCSSAMGQENALRSEIVCDSW